MNAQEHGELSQRALTEATAVEQPTMAATLQRMARDGLVEKRPDPADRRGALYRLTPHGKVTADRAREHGRAIHAAALEGVSGAERTALFESLSRVIANLETLTRKEG